MRNKNRATDVYTLSRAILDEIIEYIENTEETIDGEWGSCRDLKELIRDKQMPCLYHKLLALRKGKLFCRCDLPSMNMGGVCFKCELEVDVTQKK